MSRYPHVYDRHACGGMDTYVVCRCGVSPQMAALVGDDCPAALRERVEELEGVAMMAMGFIAEQNWPERTDGQMTFAALQRVLRRDSC